MDGQSNSEYVQNAESKHCSESYLSLFGNMLQPPYHAHWQKNYCQVYNNVDDAIRKKTRFERHTGSLERRIPCFSKWSTCEKGLEEKACTKSDIEKHDCVCCVAEDIHQPEYSEIEMQDRELDQRARCGPKASYYYNDLGYVSLRVR